VASGVRLVTDRQMGLRAISALLQAERATVSRRKVPTHAIQLQSIVIVAIVIVDRVYGRFLLRSWATMFVVSALAAVWIVQGRCRLATLKLLTSQFAGPVTIV